MKKVLCVFLTAALLLGCTALAQQASEPANNLPTVAYGASWFLTVDATLTGKVNVNTGTIPVSMRVIMLMNNMDPASLEGEGEYSGFTYENFIVDWGSSTWNVPVSMAGLQDYRGYSGCRFTMERAGEALSGRMFVDYSEAMAIDVDWKAGDESGNLSYQEAGGAPITYVFKTLPAPVGSVGREVEIELSEEYAFYFGVATIEGQLYSSAEMDQQTYDALMEQLQEYIAKEILDQEAAQQTESPAAADLQERIDIYNDKIKDREQWAEEAKATDPENWARLMLEAATLREAVTRMEAQLAAMQETK